MIGAGAGSLQAHTCRGLLQAHVAVQASDRNQGHLWVHKLLRGPWLSLCTLAAAVTGHGCIHSNGCMHSNGDQFWGPRLQRLTGSQCGSWALVGRDLCRWCL